MIDWLIFICAAVALVQGKQSAIVFVSPTIAHTVALSALDGWAYYASSATVDAITIALLCTLPNPSALTVWLQRACLASIVLNAIGWALWVSYLPPDVYDVAFILLWTAVVLMVANSGDHRGRTDRSALLHWSRPGGLGRNPTHEG